MEIREISSKSILRKNKKIDSWFISSYGMNLYRGCSHNCSYCDGRAEKYQVNGEFGKEIEVKTNTVEILNRELDPSRKRKPFDTGFFVVGGGVCDSYQPIEKKFRLTRQALELLLEYNHPVHMLTKSTLIERDIDLIKHINKKTRAIVSMSFSSVDDEISAQFEPGVPPPSERLRTMVKLKNEGIACGMFLLPVIPFVTDSSEMIGDALKAAMDAGLDYVLFGGMTLKQGRQQDHFLNVLKQYHPLLIEKYQKIFLGNEWGSASQRYYNRIYQLYSEALKRYPVAGRIPVSLFDDILEPRNLVIIFLEHIDYYLKLKGMRSPYGYAAHLISQKKIPLMTAGDSKNELAVLDPSVKKVVQEILANRNSRLYDELTKYFNT